MWFRRKNRSDDDDRLATLSRRLDDAESAIRSLKGEWIDTLERNERMLGRIVKRAARAQESLPLPDESPPSASLDEVAIRRARGTFPGGGR
jgi:hypothetical protein